MDGAAMLQAAVAALRTEDPASFSGAGALARAELLLRLQQQLEVSVLSAVLDVDLREAFVHAAAGSTRDWLRTQVAGDGGRLSRAQRWAKRPILNRAVADGQVGTTGADAVCAALTRIGELTTPGPATSPAATPVGEDQIHGIVRNAVPNLLALWIGQGLAPGERTAQHLERRGRLADILTDAANATLLAPTDRLEPVLTLLAEALAPVNLTAALGAIVDALRPEQLDAEADEVFQESYLRFSRQPGLPGWKVDGLLDDDTGTRLQAQLRSYLTRDMNPSRPAQRDTHPSASLTPPHQPEQPEPSSPDEPGHSDEPNLPFPDADSGGDDCEGEHFGSVGPGLPLAPVRFDLRGRPHPAHPVEGAPDDPDRSLRHLRNPEKPPDPAKSYADALPALLDDLEHHPQNEPGTDDRRTDPGSRRSGAAGLPAASAQVSVIISQEAFLGLPGALPATLTGPQVSSGPISLAPEVARRLSCGNLLSMLRLDQDGHYLDGSGQRRHATQAQRRAMTAHWGAHCAVNGCTNRGLIPHHVAWFSNGGRTVMTNLVPLCNHHHHDIHEGHRTLRLRDNRLISTNGWVTQQRAA